MRYFLSAMIFHETFPISKENKDYLKDFRSAIRLHDTFPVSNEMSWDTSRRKEIA